MKTALGIILTLAGVVLILGGGGYALMAMVGMYQTAMADPMADGNERHVADQMWRGATIGLAGAPLFLIGSFLLGRGLIARLLGRK